MMAVPEPEELYVSYTLFDDVYPKKATARTDVAWSALVARIQSAQEYPAKESCPLISMCEYGDRASPKGYIRHGDNVIRAFGVEFDYDGEKIGLAEAVMTLQRAGIRGVVYTSASHTDEKPRWRILLPLSEPAMPEKRAEYLGRVNRIFGGIASTESFTLSQSFYIGRVKGRQYRHGESIGRCIDLASDIEPLYPASHDELNRDSRTNDELRAAFDRGEDRYVAMLKLSSRWAAKGMAYDDICAALEDLLAKGNPLNGDGTDLRTRIVPLAESAVRKFGGKLERATVNGYIKNEPPKQPAIVLRHISEILAEKREPIWLIHKTLEASVVAVIAGPRATFKSFIALHWTMLTAIEDQSVVILSAEGGGLDRRTDAWLRTFAPKKDASTLPIVALERGINLNSAEVVAELQAAIEASGRIPKLILIDTFSKYSPGIDENDNGEVALFIQSLSVALREKYGCTVLLVAHSGHGDAKRPRGAYSLMANPDAEYIVERPDPLGMAVSVSRDRFKDSQALPPLTYTAESVDLRRIDRYGDPVTSLIVRQADQSLVKKGPTGKAQRALLAELERLTESDVDKVGVWTQEALRGIARDLGFSKSTARDAVLGLTSMRFLLPTVGGYRLDKYS